MATIRGMGQTPWVPAGTFLGTRGQNRPLEGFAIRLTGPNAQYFRVIYYGHFQDTGTTPEVFDGQFLMAPGGPRQMEGFGIKILLQSISVSGLAHIAEIGDRTYSNCFVGTRGQNKHIEGVSATLQPSVPGLLSIEYMGIIKGMGPSPWVQEGTFLGTRGQNRKIEGIAFRLVGHLAGHFHVHYLVHLQTVGDVRGKNGEMIGGPGSQIEGFHVTIERK